MTSNFQVKQAVNDEQLQQIAVLADTIWHEHFTSIIGTAQVEYMLDKFQSFPALKRQLTDGYEYYQIFDNTDFCGYCGIHPQDGKLFLSKLYLKKEARGRHFATQTFAFLKSLCQERGLCSIWPILKIILFHFALHPLLFLTDYHTPDLPHHMQIPLLRPA